MRLSWLDGARGAAALAVMAYHYADHLPEMPLFRAGYLGVDLFFVMSGFVLMEAYGGRLRSGTMGLGGYVAARLVRLWPLYALATAGGVAYQLAKALAGQDDAASPAQVGLVAGLNLLFLPNPVPAPPLGHLFPFAPASWSLSAEMVGSLAFAVLLVRLRGRWLLAAALLLGAAMVGLARSWGTLNLGWSWPTLGAGLVRTLAGITLGVLLHALHRRLGPGALPSRRPLLAVGALGLAILVLAPRNVLAVEAAAALLAFPALVLVAARTAVPARLEAACDALGRLSYPLYLLHTPVLLWVWGVAGAVGPGGRAEVSTPLTLLAAALALGASWAAARLFDEPVRARLNGALRRRGGRRAGGLGGGAAVP